MRAKVLFAVACLGISSPSFSQTTATYSYDALGRLVLSSDEQSAASTMATTITYDRAGNRVNYRVADADQPTPVPSPNNPSYTVNSAQSASFMISSLATTSAPARIVSFAPPSGGGSATIASDGQSVTYTAPSLPLSSPCEPAESRTYQVPYGVQNAAGGSVGYGTARITVRGLTRQLRPGEQCP